MQYIEEMNKTNDSLNDDSDVSIECTKTVKKSRDDMSDRFVITSRHI
jgi:hypothetical protein